MRYLISCILDFVGVMIILVTYFVLLMGLIFCCGVLANHYLGTSSIKYDTEDLNRIKIMLFVVIPISGFIFFNLGQYLSMLSYEIYYKDSSSDSEQDKVDMDELNEFRAWKNYQEQRKKRLNKK